MGVGERERPPDDRKTRPYDEEAAAAVPRERKNE